MHHSANPIGHSYMTPRKKYSEKGGFVFFGLLWVIFMLPNTYWTAIPFIIGHTNFSELALIALPFIYMLYPRRRAVWHTNALKIAIVFFWVACVFSVPLQMLFDDGSLVKIIKVNRRMIPLYTATALLFLGPRLSSNRILFHFSGAVCCSIIIGLLAYIFGFRFSGFAGTLEEEAFQISQRGRLGNVNAGFSYFGIALIGTLFGARRELRAVGGRAYSALLAVSIASMVVGVLSFNRTFLGISAIFLAVSSTFIMKPKAVFATMCLLGLGLSVGFIAYKYNRDMRYQVDKRIINPWQQGRLQETLFHSGRQAGYNLYWETLSSTKTGRGLTGVAPGRVVIRAPGGIRAVQSTDISFVTVWWRHGVFGFITWLAVGVCLAIGLNRQRKSSLQGPHKLMVVGVLTAFLLLAVASLNIDVLSRHYTVMHLAILTLTLRDRNR